MTSPLTPLGPFSLRAARSFLTGFTPAGLPAGPDDGVLRLALVLDGGGPVGVALRQEPTGEVSVDAHDDQGRPVTGQALTSQVARMLSLDVDARGLAGAVAADAQASRLVAEQPGLRPVCFGSPYEAAAWAVLSQRNRMTVAAAVRRRIARDLGTRHEVAGVELAAFPAPEVLLAVRQIEGVDERRLERLHAVARAARSGVLDGSRLRDADTDAARAALLGIPGIGPFSAELVLIRGAGAPDVFPSAEPRLHAEMGRAYGIDPGDVDRLTAVADGWRPFRSWVSFLFRRRAEDRSVRPDA